MQKSFAAVMFVFHVAMVILFATCTEYNKTVDFARYPVFQDVHIMIFIGFGFLMAFLHRNSLTTTSHSFLVASFVIPWAMLNAGFWSIASQRNLPEDKGRPEWTDIPLGIEQMITADFCAGAVLISFGAVVGKCSATQLLLMALFEVVIYHANESILLHKYYIADIGGSMVIHAFGAYFGLAASFVLEKRRPQRAEIDKSSEGSTLQSDTMAMIGTLFLWCFWPSFNGALAGTDFGKQRAFLNTVLSLASSCIVSFYMCVFLYKGKFNMVIIQNATLAGGVAMGTAADMFPRPYGSLLIGAVAGIVSCLGYKFISPALEKALGLKDTCGVHNLHGLPGVVGALVGVIVSRVAHTDEYGNEIGTLWAKRAESGNVHAENRSSSVQANYQLAALATTLVLAIVGGLVAGVLMSLCDDLPVFFDDAAEFDEVEHPVLGTVGEDNTVKELEDMPPAAKEEMANAETKKPEEESA